jgi:predicted RNA polymerase sigma factor
LPGRAIAYVKARFTSFRLTWRWPTPRLRLGRDGLNRIIELYDLLGSVVANPVVALNGAVAIAERDGPGHGLAVLETIVGMERSHLWHAARADNLQRFGRAAEAAGALETATLAPTEENGGCFCLVSSM